MQTRLGREDSEYLARSVPFYAANQPLADISEMRVVQGMDAGLYQKLKPLVCALPMTRQQININTLDVTQSVILEALFDPWLSPVQARALLQQRPAKGWEDVDQFLAPALPSRRTGCPFLVGLWLAMRNGLSAASMNAGDGAPGWRWLRSCSAPSSMSRIYRFR